jgi:hypothetical protein
MLHRPHLSTTLLIGCAAALGLCAAPVTASPVAAAAGGAGCQLVGTASITPGLTTSSQSFSYTFSGTLSGCSGTTSGVTAGKVFAGVDPNGQAETTGHPAGTGSCGSSTTSGVAVAQFNDGSTAVITYTTTGAAALVNLQGTVGGSVAFGTDTYTTSAEWSGDQAVGALTFQPASGQDCVTTPVTTAAINGATTLGSTQ